MAKPTNTPIAGEIWHLSIEDLFAPVHEKQRLGGDGPFVINLSVSTAPIGLPEKKFAGGRDAHVYQIQVTEDGRTRYRLRFGPFASEDGADAVLVEVRDMYPGALTATALAADLRAIASIQAKLDLMKPPPKKPEKAAVEVTLDLSQPLARAAAIAAATLARAPKAKNLVAPTAPDAASRPSANAIPVAAPLPELSPAWATRVLNTRVTQAHQRSAAPGPAPALTRAAAAIPTPTPISVRPVPTAIANPAPILTEIVTIAAAPRVRATPPSPVVGEPAALIPKAPPPAAAPGNPAPVATRTPEIAPKMPAPIPPPAIVEAVAPKPRDPPMSAAPSHPTPVVTRAPNPAPRPPAGAARLVLRPVISRPVAARWVSSRWVAPRPPAPRQAAPRPVAVQGPAGQKPAAQIPAAANVNPPDAGFARAELVAVATVPAAHPVKQLSQPLIDLESTQTVRALTAPELEDEAALRWFVIQLAVADQAFDPDAVPNLDIFSEYRLYSVAWMDQGHNVHALRLGFFSEEIAAVAVASYLGAHYDKPTIRRVSAAERERFAAGQRVEARKDVGETGKHAAIEITNELVDRRRRAASAAAKREKASKSAQPQSPPPR
jgi:hypothetical protein